MKQNELYVLHQLSQLTQLSLDYWQSCGLLDLNQSQKDRIKENVALHFLKAPLLIQLAMKSLLLPLQIAMAYESYLKQANSSRFLVACLAKALAPLFAYISCLVAMSAELEDHNANL